jgi:ribosomal protein S18 acetylase RimI-like enzyme
MDTSDYEVRRVRTDEWRELREIRLEMLKDTPIAFGERYEDACAKPEPEWRDRTERSAQSTRTAMFVAIDGNGQFVGTAGVFAKAEPQSPAQPQPQSQPDCPAQLDMIIYSVYVTPAHRGAHRGVASLLLDGVIRWSREVAGAREITLSVHETNDRAHAFYQRYGFVDTGGLIPYVLDESASLIEMRYEG